MGLIIEDKSKEVTKAKITIPQNAKKIFKAMKKVYEPYLNKPIQGAKILKSLANDKEYNKKGIGNKETLSNNDTISFEDARKRLERQEKLNPNSVEYQLYGGELAHNILKKGIKSARNVKKVNKVQPPKPTVQKPSAPSETSNKEIKVPNGKITYNESRKILREGCSWEEYAEDYNIRYVLREFLDNPKGKQEWGVLINPDMYAKALREFTQYGKLVKFPSNYVYQWMGIIMKNTLILRANTELVGHTQWFPYEEFEDFLCSYFDGEREIEVDTNDSMKIEIYPKEVLNLCEGDFLTPLKEVTDKYGQTYFPWMSQGDVERVVAKQDLERQKNKFSEEYGNIGDYISKFNEVPTYKGKIEIDYKTNKIYWIVDCLNFLDIIGLYDWMEMPDGSDAWSDYGLEPLEKILSQYNEDLSPEEVLVLVNRALDVYHQRGDMASIFIQGGSKTLTNIAESIEKTNGKKVYITEKQIVKLWQLQ